MYVGADMEMWKFFGRHKATPPASFRHLKEGARYRVIQAFEDFDGIEHPSGECWTFSGSSFLPYEDGRTLFVVRDDGRECQIRLQARPETQEPILDHLEAYISTDQTMKSIRITRDSVCMADDIDAPHEQQFEFEPETDAQGIAKRLLSGGYLAYVGLNATWTLALGSDQVVFGLRWGRRFIRPVDPETHKFRVTMINAVHVGYAAQQDPKILAAGLKKP